jgi:hypothetical protein
MFPDAGPGAETVTVLEGARSVRADDYGNPISFTPEARPTMAFDGDPYTSWRTGQFDDVRGDRIRIVLDRPITTDRVNLVQVLTEPRDRFVTGAVMRFDGEDATTVALGDASRTRRGQTFRFPRRTFRTFEVEIRDTNVGEQIMFGGMSAVGFGEIRLRDGARGAPVRVREVVRMPTDLLRVAGEGSAARPLVLLMNRERVLPSPARTDPERGMVRRIALPTERSFAVAADVRLARVEDDALVDRALGYTGPVVARASAHLVDAPAVRASAALDGNPATAWTTPFRAAVGSWIDVEPGRAVTVDHLDLALVADGRHSVPTALVVTNEAGERRAVRLDVPPDGPTPGATVATTATFPALSGERFRVRITAVRPVLTREYDCGCDVETPAAVAELVIPSVPEVVPPPELPDECRTDLVAVDGRPVPARLVGTTATAVALGAVHLEACGAPGAPTATVTAGTHDVVTTAGPTTGFEVDRLVWASRGGGAADTTLTPAATVRRAPTGRGPTARVVTSNRSTARVQVSGADAPFWLVLGESQNAGWRARVDGEDLGPSRLVDGYANGWLVRPDSRNVTVELEWTPQRTVQRSLAVSILAVVGCVAIVVVSTGERRRLRYVGQPVDDQPVFATPWQRAGPHVGWTSAVVGGAALALVGSAIVRPAVGILAGAAVVLVLRRPALRRVLALLPAAALATAAAYIAFRQARHHLPPIFEWPTFFARARTLAWVAVLALAADVLVEFIGNRWGTWVDHRDPGATDDVGPGDPGDEPADREPADGPQPAPESDGD